MCLEQILVKVYAVGFQWCCILSKPCIDVWIDVGDGIAGVETDAGLFVVADAGEGGHVGMKDVPLDAKEEVEKYWLCVLRRVEEAQIKDRPPH